MFYLRRLVSLQATDDVGYFRKFGFGVVSVYKSDLEAAGGFDTTIAGWGGEDIDIVEKVRSCNQLSN